MSTARVHRPDPFVLIVCTAAALLMTALTLGASLPSVERPSAAIAFFVVLGVAPYALTVALTCLPGLRRLVLSTARAVAVVYGAFDNFLRYQALYHPPDPPIRSWWSSCRSGGPSASWS
jgi:hypothetical protein